MCANFYIKFTLGMFKMLVYLKRFPFVLSIYFLPPKINQTALQFLTPDTKKYTMQSNWNIYPLQNKYKCIHFTNFCNFVSINENGRETYKAGFEHGGPQIVNYYWIIQWTRAIWLADFENLNHLVLGIMIICIAFSE